MANEGVEEVELGEVHTCIDMEVPAADPGTSGRTPEDVLVARESGKEAKVPKDQNEGSQEGSPEIVAQDDEITAGGHETPAANPSGRTLEDVLEDLNKAIKDDDVGAFKQHLAELERLLQDDSSVAERLTASGALCRAAFVGSTPMIDALIEKGVDIDSSKAHFSGSEWTPLHVAARYSSADTVRHLIDKGADVNIKDDDGCTPLLVAARSGRADTVRYLIDKGADVNIKDDDGKTPLHLAAKSRRDESVRYLVDKVADVNIRDDDGNAPLHLAAMWGESDIVRCLIDSGAHVNIRNHLGTTPLHMATKNHREDTMKFLVARGANVNIKDAEDVLGNLKKAIQGGDVESFNSRIVQVEEIFQDEDSTASGLAVSSALTVSGALCYAAWVRSTPMMDTLIEKGVDVNTKSSRIEIDGMRQKWIPLHVGARRGRVDTMIHLIEKGADVNIKMDNRRSPLHLATKHGNADAVSYLTDKGADVNIKDVDGNTPLHLAAIQGNIDAVSYLVDKGADVNSKDNAERAPIHRACCFGNAETVKYFLEKGADPTAKDQHGWNSLAIAICYRSKDAAAVLLGCKDRKWCAEMLRCSSGGTTLMRQLIADMPDVAEIALSRCVVTNEGKDFKGDEVHATTETFEVRYNYEFIEDFKDEHSSDSTESSNSAESWRPEKFKKEDHPLNLMMKLGCSNLLKHPLVISLLEHKWTRFGRYIFFGNLFLYLIFLAFLTAFGLVVLSPVERTCIHVFNGSFNGTEDCEGLSIHEYRFLYVGASVTILTALLRLAIEIFQLCTHPLEYLLDWVNWLEIPLYLFSIIFTFVFATPCLCVCSWQWQIGVVDVFLGWVGLITFLRKLPTTGVYVLMFVNILGSFMKIAFLALLLVIAFAFAFYMLLFDPNEMRTPFSHAGRAVVKVMAMTIGELDFDELYHQQDGQDEISFPPLSFLFWIIFLIVMPVLLSNLLVGLAVGDVDRLQKAASENRIKLQIDLVLSFEELLESLGIRHWFAIKPKTHYPNVPVTLLPQWCKKRGVDDDILVKYPDDCDPGRLGKVRRWIAKRYSKLWITDEYSTSGVKVSDAIKPPPEPLEKLLQKQQQHLQAQLQKQSEQIDTKLQKQSKQFETKLEEQLEVNVKEQNEHQSDKLEAKLKEQFSEYHKEQAKQSEEQAKRMEEQAKQSEQQAKRMEEQAKRMEEQAKRMEEQAKQSEEQAKRMEEQAKKAEEKTEQLAGEVASLREALEKLVAQMTVK